MLNYVMLGHLEFQIKTCQLCKWPDNDH